MIIIMLREIAVHFGCPFQLICRFIDVNVGITIKIIAMHFLIIFIAILAIAYILPTGVNVMRFAMKIIMKNDVNGKQRFKTMQHHLVVP